MVNNKETGQNDNMLSAHDNPTPDTPPSSHQAIAADKKAASRRLPAPTSLLMSSSKPATKTGIATMNSTGHTPVRVMFLGTSTSKPARLPATPTRPPTPGEARAREATGRVRSRGRDVSNEQHPGVGR